MDELNDDALNFRTEFWRSVALQLDYMLQFLMLTPKMELDVKLLLLLNKVLKIHSCQFQCMVATTLILLCLEAGMDHGY